MRKRLSEKVFQVVDIAIMLVILAIVIFPLLNIIAVSVSDRSHIISGSVGLWPKGFNISAYRKIISNSVFLRSMANTIGIVAVATFLSVIVTLLAAYGLTRNFVGKKFVTYCFVDTMYFSGGLIPTYIVVAMTLNLRNTYLALILPTLVNMFFIIVMRSQIDNIPKSIFESAYIAGAGEYQTAFLVVIPVITPTIAAVSMFIALNYWNMWFNVMIYTDKKELWTLQYFLRVVVFDQLIGAAEEAEGALEENIPPENFRMAAIVLVAAPIVSIYPFVQKYFVKGIIAGSVKG